MDQSKSVWVYTCAYEYSGNDWNIEWMCSYACSYACGVCESILVYIQRRDICMYICMHTYIIYISKYSIDMHTRTFTYAFVEAFVSIITHNRNVPVSWKVPFTPSAANSFEPTCKTRPVAVAEAAMNGFPDLEPPWDEIHRCRHTQSYISITRLNWLKLAISLLTVPECNLINATIFALLLLQYASSIPEEEHWTRLYSTMKLLRQAETETRCQMSQVVSRPRLPSTTQSKL